MSMFKDFLTETAANVTFASECDKLFKKAREDYLDRLQVLLEQIDGVKNLKIKSPDYPSSDFQYTTINFDWKDTYGKTLLFEGDLSISGYSIHGKLGKDGLPEKDWIVLPSSKKPSSLQENLFKAAKKLK